jgi:hypothetical protein
VRVPAVRGLGGGHAGLRSRDRGSQGTEVAQWGAAPGAVAPPPLRRRSGLRRPNRLSVAAVGGQGTRRRRWPGRAQGLRKTGPGRSGPTARAAAAEEVHAPPANGGNRAEGRALGAARHENSFAVDSCRRPGRGHACRRVRAGTAPVRSVRRVTEGCRPANRAVHRGTRHVERYGGEDLTVNACSREPKASRAARRAGSGPSALPGRH